MARDRQEVRRRILAVAKRHLETFGFRRTVIDEIVREAGVAKGTFYLHFPSKDDLCQQVVEDVNRALGAEALARMMKETTVTGRLRLLLRFPFEALEREPLLARVLTEDPDFRLVHQLLEGRMSKDFDDGIAFLRALLQEGIARGELRPDVDLQVTPFVLGALRFLHAYKALCTKGRITEDQLVDGIVELAMRGLVRGEQGHA